MNDDACPTSSGVGVLVWRGNNGGKCVVGRYWVQSGGHTMGVSVWQGVLVQSGGHTMGVSVWQGGISVVRGSYNGGKCVVGRYWVWSGGTGIYTYLPSQETSLTLNRCSSFLSCSRMLTARHNPVRKACKYSTLQSRLIASTQSTVVQLSYSQQQVAVYIGVNALLALTIQCVVVWGLITLNPESASNFKRGSMNCVEL